MFYMYIYMLPCDKQLTDFKIPIRNQVHRYAATKGKGKVQGHNISNSKETNPKSKTSSI